jgi:hypothetical protein
MAEVSQSVESFPYGTTRLQFDLMGWSAGMDFFPKKRFTPFEKFIYIDARKQATTRASPSQQKVIV